MIQLTYSTNTKRESMKIGPQRNNKNTKKIEVSRKIIDLFFHFILFSLFLLRKQKPFYCIAIGAWVMYAWMQGKNFYFTLYMRILNGILQLSRDWKRMNDNDESERMREKCEGMIFSMMCQRFVSNKKKN